MEFNGNLLLCLPNCSSELSIPCPPNSRDVASITHPGQRFASRLSASSVIHRNLGVTCISDQFLPIKGFVAMPARSNKFQKLIARLHQITASAGATVSESAMVQERGSGTMREIDILIQSSINGIGISIAVECRDHVRTQSVEWIDNLIGKYDNLDIDRVVAISSTRFSRSAIKKAKDHRIECISCADTDEITLNLIIPQTFKAITNTNTLMLITTFDENDNKISSSELIDGKWINTDSISQLIQKTLYQMFFKLHSNIIGVAINKMLSAKYSCSSIVNDPRPKYGEWSISGGWYILTPTGKFEFHRIVYGVGVHFAIEECLVYGKRVGESVIWQFEANAYGTKFEVNNVATEDENIIAIFVE